MGYWLFYFESGSRANIILLPIGCQWLTTEGLHGAWGCLYLKLPGTGQSSHSAPYCYGFMMACCTTGSGQLLPYADDQRTATVQQLRTYSSNKNGDPQAAEINLLKLLVS
jgi:hypothetical protein